jgi:hypothetical protein
MPFIDGETLGERLNTERQLGVEEAGGVAPTGCASVEPRRGRS